MLSQYTYICPYCQHVLSNELHIKLGVERGNGEKAVMHLHPKPGIYEFECIPGLDFEEGEAVTFCCSDCSVDLTSDEYFNFSEVTMQVNGRINFQVLFSRIHGEQKTYVVTEDFDQVSLKNFSA